MSRQLLLCPQFRPYLSSLIFSYEIRKRMAMFSCVSHGGRFGSSAGLLVILAEGPLSGVKRKLKSLEMLKFNFRFRPIAVSQDDHFEVILATNTFS
jgi:hypothetical protein